MEGLGLKIVVEGKKIKAFGSPKAFYKHLMKSAKRTLFSRAPPPTVETDC